MPRYMSTSTTILAVGMGHELGGVRYGARDWNGAGDRKGASNENKCDRVSARVLYKTKLTRFIPVEHR